MIKLCPLYLPYLGSRSSTSLTWAPKAAPPLPGLPKQHPPYLGSQSSTSLTWAPKAAPPLPGLPKQHLPYLGSQSTCLLTSFSVHHVCITSRGSSICAAYGRIPQPECEVLEIRKPPVFALVPPTVLTMRLLTYIGNC